MKKVITIVAVAIAVAISISSCRASRGYGCPDTYRMVGYNPR